MITDEKGISVGELLTAKLHEIVCGRKSYERAKKRALAQLRNSTNRGWVRPVSRDELHER